MAVSTKAFRSPSYAHEVEAAERWLNASSIGIIAISSESPAAGGGGGGSGSTILPTIGSPPSHAFAAVDAGVAGGGAGGAAAALFACFGVAIWEEKARESTSCCAQRSSSNVSVRAIGPPCDLSVACSASI